VLALLAAAAWALSDVPSVDNPGLRGAFGGLFAAAVVVGAWGTARASPAAARLAAAFLGPYVAVGAYAARREFWLLLLYVVLLLAFLELHQYHRLVAKLPPGGAAASSRTLLRAVAKMLALLSLGYALALLLANVAAVTFLGTTDIASAFLLGVSLLAVVSSLALAGGARRRPA